MRSAPIQDTEILGRVVYSESMFIEMYLEHLNPNVAVHHMLEREDPDFLTFDLEEGDLDKIATLLLSRIPVQEALTNRLTHAVQAQRLVTQRWVLDQSVSVYSKCVQEAEILDNRGEWVKGPFQPIAALRALELVGKHVDIQAFKEKIEVETGPDLAEALAQARKRAENRAILGDKDTAENASFTDADGQ